MGGVNYKEAAMGILDGEGNIHILILVEVTQLHVLI